MNPFICLHSTYKIKRSAYLDEFVSKLEIDVIDAVKCGLIKNALKLENVLIEQETYICGINQQKTNIVLEKIVSI